MFGGKQSQTGSGEPTSQETRKREMVVLTPLFVQELSSVCILSEIYIKWGLSEGLAKKDRVTVSDLDRLGGYFTTRR